jgi:glycosyltransferase involved in cell wall biosynthesis
VAALRRADGTRAVGPFTARLLEEATGRRPLASYPTYFDLGAFRDPPPEPMPAVPAVAWVGALERVKNVAGFAAAWQEVSARLPAARLTIVGDGRLRSIADDLHRRQPQRVRVARRLDQSEVARVLDDSTLLALPSLSEGTPRVVMEAFARARPVVASSVGGIPDLLDDEQEGLLVPPGDVESLAGAMIKLLGDPSLAQRLGAQAHRTSQAFDWSPDRLADELAGLVQRLLGR